MENVGSKQAEGCFLIYSGTCSHAYFYKQHFYQQRQTGLAKN